MKKDRSLSLTFAELEDAEFCDGSLLTPGILAGPELSHALEDRERSDSFAFLGMFDGEEKQRRSHSIGSIGDELACRQQRCDSIAKTLCLVDMSKPSELKHEEEEAEAAVIDVDVVPPMEIHSPTLSVAPMKILPREYVAPEVPKKAFALEMKPRRACQQTERVGTYSPEERARRIARFHEKRKTRKWYKKVKYGCRKKLADSRPRLKGRFVTKAEMAQFKAESGVRYTISASVQHHQQQQGQQQQVEHGELGEQSSRQSSFEMGPSFSFGRVIQPVR